MLARVNGAYRPVRAFARVNGAYMAVKNVYALINGAYRPVWAYTWDAAPWGACSVTCGGGTQTRTVRCLRNDGMVMEDRFCEAAKPAVSQVCNTHPCYTYSWQMDSWSECSKPCGNGTQTRTGRCVRNDGLVVSASYCGSKPSTSRSCNNGRCSWYVGSWGSWSTSCGNAYRSRSVYCQDPYGYEVDSSYCSGSPQNDFEQSLICTKCSYNENAYLANKLYFDQSMGEFKDNYKDCGLSTGDTTKWSISTMRTYFTKCMGITVKYHYDAFSSYENLCGHSGCDCCAREGRFNCKR